MLYIVILVLTNIVTFFITAVVIGSTSVSKALRAFFSLTALSLLFWQDSILVTDLSVSHLVFFNTILFIWPTLSLLGMYGFIRAIHGLEGKQTKRQIPRTTRVIFALFYVGFFLQLSAVGSMHIFTQVLALGNDQFNFSRSYGYYIYISGITLSFIALIIRFITIRRTHSMREKRALRTLLITVITTVLYGAVTNVLIPLVTNSQGLIGLGVATVDIFSIGLAISIFKGHLLDVKPYVVRSVAYAASIAVLGTIYVVVVFATSQLFLGRFEITIMTVSNVIVALGIVFLFQPIKSFFDKATNRLFFKNSYDSDTFFSQVNHELTLTTNLHQLLERVARVITQTLHAEYGLFVVRYGTDDMISVGTTKRLRITLEEINNLNNDLGSQRQPLIYNMLDTEMTNVRHFMRRHKVALLLPLQRSATPLDGYLLLGPHQSGQYSMRDQRVLEAVANELVIAIQNASSIEQVKELNETLQQRINEATKELRASNRQLQRLDEAKDEFVSMASHQLRTPLTSVKGYIDMVLEGDAGEITPMQHQLLSEAFTSSERMVHLINDFLNVSRLQTGKFIIDRRQIDLAKVSAQEVDSLRTTAQARDLKLQFRAPSHFPLLYLDEGKIRQVIMNFIDNAIYYSHAQSTITISLESHNGEVFLRVHDTGIGIPESEQANLFTKFFRATNARKQRPDGTGVGLFLAKKVIVAHGGSMIVESVEGEGSTFGFRLPIKTLSLPPADDLNDANNHENEHNQNTEHNTAHS